MNSLRQVYLLQQVDQDLWEKRRALEWVESQLRNTEELDSLRSELAAEQQKLEALEEAQQSVEWEIRDLRDKVRGFEAQLYGGKVSNPRELLSIQQEVDILKGRQREQEDRVLDIMVDVEAAQARVMARAAELQATEREWQKRQSELQREQVQLNEAIASLEQDRMRMSSEISRTTLELYEDIRARRGQAVAKVERGMCQGCRLTLPISEWQRVRSGALVQCSSCGRILYLE